MIKPGIYEQVINKQLGKEIDAATDKLSSTMGIDPAEASKVLAQSVPQANGVADDFPAATRPWPAPCRGEGVSDCFRLYRSGKQKI